MAALSDGTNENGGHVVFETRAAGGSLSEKLRIEGSGNVGIGTVDPDAAFHVHASSPQVRLTSSADSGTPLAQIGYASGSGYFLRLGDAANNEDVMIRSYGNTVFNGGYVGIGTSSPIAPLHVLGNAVIETGSPDLYLATTSASHTNWRIAAQEVVNQGFEIASGTTSAGSNAVADTYTTRLTIKNDGKVGIGTTSPGTKVHVYGTDSSIQL